MLLREVPAREAARCTKIQRMTASQSLPVALADIEAAGERVYALAHRTPLLHSHPLSEKLGASCYFKAEMLQRTGSFKVRGAANRLSLLNGDERSRGVVTASAGNHAQGVALSASTLRIPCTIVMPREASLAKVTAPRSYGVDVVLEGADFSEAADHARKLSAERGLVFVPAFNDPLVIAGQGTVGLEILADLPDVHTVIVPIGGGGLAGGVGLAVKSIRPRCRVIGVQSEAATGAYRSYRSGSIENVKAATTIADGIAVGAPGEYTLPLLREYLDDVVLVDDEAVASAMLFLVERCKLLVEGAGAVSVAALFAGAVSARDGTVAVLSGGNVDVHLLGEVIEHGLSNAGRFQTLVVTLPDRPGQLSRVLAAISEKRGNILTIDHRRTGPDLPLNFVEVSLVLETRDAAHGEEITRALEALGLAPDTTTKAVRRLRA